MENAKLKLKYPLVVEGKYDKIRLSSFIKSPIITLGGFSAFNSKDKLTELATFGKSGGLIILTDSDKAGTFIRGKLKGLLPGVKLINVYAPAIYGRDSRRNHTNKEGILGVESLDNGVLYRILQPFESEINKNDYLTKQRAYQDGLSGRANSTNLRKKLCSLLSLPEGLSAAMLIDYINCFVSEDEYKTLLDKVKEDK
ncbi:MAG: toprim domain-containing protein [Eubacteriales bacterium]|jgi:ribonuclease M5